MAVALEGCSDGVVLQAIPADRSRGSCSDVGNLQGTCVSEVEQAARLSAYLLLIVFVSIVREKLA